MLTLKTQNLTTDWHCHILPGLDDGPATMDEAVEMAKALHQAGYTTVHCTPHLIKGSFEADNATVKAILAALQAELTQQQVDLELLPGREYYLDEFLLDYLKEPLPLGKTRFILIEIPHHAPVEFVKETSYRITCSGYTPMIAHPERCRLLDPKLQNENRKGLWGSLFNSKLKTLQARSLGQNSKPAENSLLAYLLDIGCQFQGNLGSFAGFYGERTRASAGQLREMGLYNCFGSDGHSAEGLKAVLRVEF